MTFFWNMLPVTWPWLVLSVALVAGWVRWTELSALLLALFLVIAVSLNLISPTALCVVLLGLLGASQLPKLHGMPAIAGHGAFVIWCVVLGAHLLPGVHNLQVLDQVRSGPDSAVFTLFLNLDKPIVALAVFLAWPALLTAKHPTQFLPLTFGLVLLPILFALGLSVGAIRPETALPEWWLLFALSNLFLTCLAEEAFFRGYVQSVLSARLGSIAGVIGASFLFGLAHAPGGAALVAFASLLGLACGLGYHATGRLWVPVAMHFIFNMAHLVLFTYPAPA